MKTVLPSEVEGSRCEIETLVPRARSTPLRFARDDK